LKNHLPILIIIFPLVIAFLILFLKKYSVQLSLTGIFASLFLLLRLTSEILNGNTIAYHLGGWEGPMGITLVIDGLSFYFSFLVLCAGIYIIFYSLYEEKYSSSYYFFLLLSISSMLGVIFTGDIFNMYIFYELLTISTYLLIAYLKKGKSLKASFNYLIMGGVGLSFFLLGVGFLYALFGFLDIALIAENFLDIYLVHREMLMVSFALMVIGIGIKVALFPLHGWLPDAHSLAPSSVSALLSGITVKIGIYCLIRILYGIFSLEKYFFRRTGQIFLILGSVTLLFGATMALAQIDLKRLLAFSTINQIGIIMIGFGIGTKAGITGALFHILNHAILKISLFFCAGIIIKKTGSRLLQDLKGFGRREPFIVLSFTIASMGMIGIPSVNGFISKFIICSAAIEAGFPLIVVIILIASVITAAYYFKIIVLFFDSSETSVKITKPSGKEMTSLRIIFGYWPVYALTGVSVFLGIFPTFGINLLEPAVKLILSNFVP